MNQRAISGGAPRIGPHRKDVSGDTLDGVDGSNAQGSSDQRKGVARR
jgi:hypothetical protein